MKTLRGCSEAISQTISRIDNLEISAIALQLKAQVQSQDFNYAYYLGFQDALKEIKNTLLTNFNSYNKL